MNGFPAQLLDRTTERFLNSVHNRPNKQTDQQRKDEKALTVFLPYLGMYTNRLEKKIKQTLKQHLPSIRVTFTFRASTRLQTMFSFKDKIPNYLHANIVYKYTCGRCNSTYIGETTRHAKTRFCEHMGKSALTGKPMLRVVPSAINEHNQTCNSVIKLTDFTVLCKDASSEHALQIKETLLIHRDKPSLNDRQGSVPLNLFEL